MTDETVDSPQIQKSKTYREISAMWWRQFGFWGLSVNVVFGLPVIGLLAWYDPEQPNLDMLLDTYEVALYVWAAAVGIRQWGKNSVPNSE